MMDPGRLAARDTTPFENRLLSAARNESIPSEMKLRMSQGLNLSAAAMGGTSAVGLLSLKTGAFVVVGLVAVAGLVGTHLKREVKSGAPSVAVAPPAPPSAPPPPLEAVPAPGLPAESEAPVMIPTEPSASAQVAQSAPRARSFASASPVTRNRDAALREEIALLDAARSALAAHDPTKAMTIIGRYNHRFAHGTFAPEALVLRIEALADAGDTETARVLAGRFLKAHPQSPLAERVEKLARADR